MEIGMCWRRRVGEHLKIVVSDPSQDPKVYSVSISTLRPDYGDHSCLMNPGELEFVHHESFISYQHGIIRDNRDMDRALAAGQLIVEDYRASQDLLNRIYKGALVSDFITMDALNLLRAQGFVDS